MLSVLVGVLGLLPSTMNGWGILAELLNYTNYYMVWMFGVTGDAHAGLPPESSMLWSLAVEEHFYLIFPALMILALRRKLSLRRIGYILVAACALAPVWRLGLALNGADFYRLYVSTDTRFDGLLAGAAMALLANPALSDRAPFGVGERALRFVVAPIAAVVFTAAAVAPSAWTLIIGDTIIYACLVPLFWVVIARPDGFAGRVLNNRLVAHIGVLSFSIYLLHRLVLALVSLVIDVAPVIDAASLVIVLAVAQVLYVTVEKPLGRVRRRLESGTRSGTEK
jgi:peptidoglycan/LPS O-acetylase OafA/YrhL